jgi:uncharacterized protein YndB with AHSA1/START domain
MYLYSGMIRTSSGEIRRDGDTLAVVFDREYAATPDEIWSALTTPQRLARWLATPIGTLARGHTVRLVLTGTDDGIVGTGTDDPIVGTGTDDPMGTLRIDVCDRPHRVEGHWTWPDGQPTTLRVTIEPRPDGRARVVLTHAGFPPAGIAGYGCGWHHYVDALAAHLGDGPAPDFADYYPAMLDTYRAAVAEAGGATA